MANTWFPRWRPSAAKPGELVAPDETLPLGQTLLMGVQHTVAMFGSTVLAPLLMGFDPNLAILMSGIGTLLFFMVVGGRVPSYLGSSFGFIGVVIAVSGYGGHGPNLHMAEALGGILACGVLCAIVGCLVMALGAGWIERLMPPLVTGAVVAVIGLNLAPVAVRSVSASGADSALALLTILCIAAVARFGRGNWQRLLILVGLLLAYTLTVLLSNVILPFIGTMTSAGAAAWPTTIKPVSFTAVAAAPWIGLPTFSRPSFSIRGMLMIMPVAIILIAENLGHVKAVGAMAQKPLDAYMGRAFLGDGLATVLSASFGGTGVTTYAENIGVMAVTRVYSTLVFVAAACIAIFLGLSPKFGALVQTIPTSVLGGTSIVVFGLIAVAGARIWMQNQVDFRDNRNLLTAAVTLVLGAGDFTIHLWGFPLGGIGTATLAAIVLNGLFTASRRKPS